MGTGHRGRVAGPVPAPDRAPHRRRRGRPRRTDGAARRVHDALFRARPAREPRRDLPERGGCGCGSTPGRLRTSRSRRCAGQRAVARTAAPFDGTAAELTVLEGPCRRVPLQVDGDQIGIARSWEFAVAPAAVRLIGNWPARRGSGRTWCSVAPLRSECIAPALRPRRMVAGLADQSPPWAPVQS